MILRDVMRAQGAACASLGSPFMDILLGTIADNITAGDPIFDRLLNWHGDIGGNADNVSLRLAGGLHALVLTKKSPELAAQYPPNTPNKDALWAALHHAFAHHTDHIQYWLNSPPQTNEVRRSAVIIPAAHLIARHFGKPIALSELGASGGLNLMFDHFALETGAVSYTPDTPALRLTPDWQGAAPPPADLRITQRRGVDLNPLDPNKADDQLRLRAYLWADQPERITRTDAAISVSAGTIDTGDVEAWLRTRLEDTIPDTTHVIYHTVAWQYFPEQTAKECRDLIESAGARATQDAPLAWFGMETDRSGARGAKLSLRLWPGDITLDLGRADFHARWVNWRGDTP